jgi:hypothetical protein
LRTTTFKSERSRILVVENVQQEGEMTHGWLARIPWQIQAAVVVVLVYLGIAFTLYLRLKHLPGPFYGGDLYAHHGFALNYIANGFWTDPYFINNYAFYPWLGNYVFIFLHFVTGLSLMRAEMFVGLLTTMLSAIAFYFLGWQLFRNHTWSLVLMLLSVVTRGIPDGAPNLVPWMITIPFWFAFWLRAEETHKLRDNALAGLFMGFTGLAHVAFFLAGMALFVFTIVIETLLKRDKKQAMFNALKMYLPMFIVGFLISLLFYGPILVNYHAKTLNPLFEYNGPDISTLGIGWAISTLYRYTVDFSSWQAAILSALSVLGLVVCVMNWQKKPARYAVLWYIAGTLAPLHFLVTRPLLGRWVLPSHLWGVWIALLVFAVYGVRTVQQMVEKRKPEAASWVLGGVLILVAGLFVLRYQEYNANPWTQFGERMEPQTQAMLTLGQWMQNNTGPNAVVLSNDETCFAVNGVSGRKCVFVRRTHANYFVDVEQRYADGVVMLFGNNSEHTKKLLDGYQVEYVVVDTYMQQQAILVDAKYESYLAENHVLFSKVRARKDPATPNAVVFDMLAVPYSELNPELQSRLTAVTVMQVNNQPFIQVMKVSR